MTNKENEINFPSLAELKQKVIDEIRWNSVGVSSEEEYQEHLARNRKLAGYIAHLRDRETTPRVVKHVACCNKSSYGCPNCNPGAYAGEGYYSNDPAVKP